MVDDDSFVVTVYYIDCKWWLLLSIVVKGCLWMVGETPMKVWWPANSNIGVEVHVVNKCLTMVKLMVNWQWMIVNSLRSGLQVQRSSTHPTSYISLLTLAYHCPAENILQVTGRTKTASWHALNKKYPAEAILHNNGSCWQLISCLKRLLHPGLATGSNCSPFFKAWRHWGLSKSKCSGQCCIHWIAGFMRHGLSCKQNGERCHIWWNMRRQVCVWVSLHTYMHYIHSYQHMYMHLCWK